MVKQCPFCGIELIELVNGKKFCPNCGFIEDKKESEENEPSYIR